MHCFGKTHRHALSTSQYAAPHSPYPSASTLCRSRSPRDATHIHVLSCSCPSTHIRCKCMRVDYAVCCVQQSRCYAASSAAQMACSCITVKHIVNCVQQPRCSAESPDPYTRSVTLSCRVFWPCTCASHYGVMQSLQALCTLYHITAASTQTSWRLSSNSC